MSNTALKYSPDMSFFNAGLESADPELFASVKAEHQRQQNQIELIASENITSFAVMQAQGSVLTNKYAEGYPGRRYYQGCAHVDEIETLAIERLKKIFGAEYANVQANSGSQANQAVYLALLQPNDKILGMSLAAGGHLTHGAKPNQSGKWLNAIQYGVRREDGLIDFDEVERLAKEHRPKMIVAGASAYPRVIDWARFRAIADSIDAYLLVDMAHYAGVIAGGAYPNPMAHAHVVTSTTHKTLRGPRGGIVLTNDGDIAKKINSAIFPGLQGGPLEHVIAGKAVAFGQALKPEFKVYAQAVVSNAKILSDSLIAGGLDIVTGGTDSHIVLVDLRPKGLTGRAADDALERAGITCNKNSVPFDPEKPMVTSGIRLGTPAGTTRGFGPKEWQDIAAYILEILDGLVENGAEGNVVVETAVRKKVEALCERFPIYDSPFA